MLALVSYLRPNLLLLDEPTNHLDLEMRQALAVALQDYDGAVVLVSHDRHLLRATADELLLVHDGRVAPFDGDLDDYARWFLERERAAVERAPSAQSAEVRRQRKREEAERRNRLSPLRAEVARLERDLARLASERATIESALSTPEIYRDDAKTKLRELLDTQTRLQRETAAVEAAWLEASESLERALATAS